MGARTSLVLKDRASTPVDHTFTPDGDDANGVHVFSEKTGVPVGDSRITASLRRSNGKYRPSLRIVVPVTQERDDNGITSDVVVRTAYANIDFVFDAASTEQERKDAVGFAQNILAASQTMINDLLVNYADIY